MRLAVHTSGSGTKRAALLHGISGDGAIFADLTAILTDRLGYTVSAVDLRGHGDSPRADSYSLAEFADDVVETLPAGLDVVIGHSLGGRVLLDAVARLAPRRAIYLDPAFEAPAGTSELASRANVGEHDDGTPYSHDELAALNPRWGDRNLERAAASHARWDGRMFTPLMTGIGGVTAPDGPPAVPSIVLRADPSDLIGPELARRLESFGWTVRTQPGAGHNLHLDDADATVRALDGWL